MMPSREALMINCCVKFCGLLYGMTAKEVIQSTCDITCDSVESSPPVDPPPPPPPPPPLDAVFNSLNTSTPSMT